MTDSPHLKLLRKSLEQLEDGIECVSSDHDRKGIGTGRRRIAEGH